MGSCDDLERDPAGGAQFATLPAAAGKAKQFDGWKNDLSGWLFRTQKVELFRSPSTKALSMPGEPERDFRVRLQQAGREQRDQQSEVLRKKYSPKIVALQDRIRRAEQMVERQQAESRSSQIQAAISTTAIRGAGRAMKESKDVSQAEDNVAALQQQLAALEAEFKAEADALAAATDPLTEKLETLSLKPSKSNISIKLVALVWVPHWRAADGTSLPAWS